MESFAFWLFKVCKRISISRESRTTPRVIWFQKPDRSRHVKEAVVEKCNHETIYFLEVFHMSKPLTVVYMSAGRDFATPV